MAITLTITGENASEFLTQLVATAQTLILSNVTASTVAPTVPAEPAKRTRKTQERETVIVERPIEEPAEVVTPEEIEAIAELPAPITEEPKRVTLEELRAVIAPKMAEHRATLGEIFAAYGAKTLAALEKAHYAEVLEKVKAL